MGGPFQVTIFIALTVRSYKSETCGVRLQIVDVGLNYNLTTILPSKEIMTSRKYTGQKSEAIVSRAYTFYDRANKTIMNRQLNRVKEVTGIILLRDLTAVPWFDTRFKTKVHRHSQNGDGNSGPIPSGVSGCLTGRYAFVKWTYSNFFFECGSK